MTCNLFVKISTHPSVSLVVAMALFLFLAQSLIPLPPMLSLLFTKTLPQEESETLATLGFLRPKAKNRSNLIDIDPGVVWLILSVTGLLVKQVL